MRSFLEGGLVAVIGAAWAAFLAFLVVGPGRAEALLGEWRRGEARERVPSWGGSRALRRDEVVRLPRRHDGAVRVEEGLVLVTGEGDPEDHVLGPGAALPLSGRGMVAWALAESRIALVAQGEAVRAPPGALAGQVR